MADRFRLSDGTWSCVRDGVTEPCGDCDGCRYIAAVNAADDAFLGNVDDWKPLGLIPASNGTGIYEIVGARRALNGDGNG